MSENAFFKYSDVRSESLCGFKIQPEWWSRLYEYPWAFRYAIPDTVVADMGCGYAPRPFKDALSTICKHVYAVDAHEKLLELERPENVEFVVANFTRQIHAIPDESLDTVFCISTLEHVHKDGRISALEEFARCMKPDGLCILTVDVQYDMNKTLDYWGAIKLEELEDDIFEAGLRLRIPQDYSKVGAVYHKMFNLCVFHYVLEKVND